MATLHRRLLKFANERPYQAHICEGRASAGPISLRPHAQMTKEERVFIASQKDEHAKNESNIMHSFLPRGQNCACALTKTNARAIRTLAQCS